MIELNPLSCIDVSVDDVRLKKAKHLFQNVITSE